MDEPTASEDVKPQQKAHIAFPGEKILQGIVAINVFMMMCIIFIDVFLRYVFNAPIPGSYEIIRFMMGIMIFSAIPLVTATQGHIVVELFDGAFKGRAGKIRDVCVGLVSFCSLGMVTYLMYVQAGQLARFNKITGYLELPLSPLAYFMSALAVVAMLAQLQLIWTRITDKGPAQ